MKIKTESLIHYARAFRRSIVRFAPLRLCESFVVAGVLSIGSASLVSAQDGSLLHNVPPPTTQDQAAALTLQNSSFMFRKTPMNAMSRELQINDIITVLVDYRSSMISEGDAESRKTANLNAVLQDWLAFDGKSIFNAPMRRGQPSINGQLQSQYRTESDMELRDMLTFRIAATIVDIRPNGNLVIEARREIRIDEEVWMQTLTGEISRSAIGPDRTVRSDEVHALSVTKCNKGFIKDAYTRGWAARWYGKWKPF